MYILCKNYYRYSKIILGLSEYKIYFPFYKIYVTESRINLIH